MFFIGILGLGSKEEQKQLSRVIENCHNPMLIRRYQQFHVFFIPLYKWRFEYYISCGQHKVLELKEDKGERLWRGEDIEVTYWDYRVLKEEKRCTQCGHVLKPEYEFCPNCGMKIKS